MHIQISMSKHKVCRQGGKSFLNENTLNQIQDLFLIHSETGSDKRRSKPVFHFGPDAEMKKSNHKNRWKDGRSKVGCLFPILTPALLSLALSLSFPPCSAPTTPTLSSTSLRTIPPSCASFAATSSNSSTAPTPRAGGAVATDTWATSLQSTSSPSTSASDLWPSDKTSASAPLRVLSPAAYTSPLLCSHPRLSGADKWTSELLAMLPTDYPSSPPVMSPVRHKPRPISTTEAVGHFLLTVLLI